MSTQRAHINFPDSLLREIDALVGARGRSAFVIETMREAVRRRRLQEFLESNVVHWKDEDHPELAHGSAAWVKGIRNESEERFPKQMRGAEKA